MREWSRSGGVFGGEEGVGLSKRRSCSAVWCRADRSTDEGRLWEIIDERGWNERVL